MKIQSRQRARVYKKHSRSSAEHNLYQKDIDIGDSQRAQSKIGNQAPEQFMNEVTDAKQPDDDIVEFPEVVVIIGRTHWRCITCMTLYPGSEGIDSHIRQHHGQHFLPAAPADVKRGRDGGGSSLGRSQDTVSRTPAANGRSVAKTGIVENPQPKLRRGSGRGRGRGRPSRGGRNRSGRGRGERVSAKPLTTDDSDTEVEAQPASVSLEVSRPTPQKRKLGSTSELDVNVSSEVLPSIQSKKPRDSEDDRVPTKSTIKCHSPVSTSNKMMKEVLKEKYVVIIEPAGGPDSPSECVGHVDNEPPLPIETPSLQADSLLPPATPLLPDIQGPPETPLLPETPQALLTDPFDSSETVAAVDLQEASDPKVCLPPETGSMLSDILPESLVHTQEIHSSEKSSSADCGFTSSSVPLLEKTVDSDSGLVSVCKICKVVFESPEALRWHREDVMKFEDVSCSDCGSMFHGLHLLNIHVFTSHEKFASKFCFLCDAGCLDLFALEEHLLEHITFGRDGGNIADVFSSVLHTCKTCREHLRGNQSDLISHYHTAHNQFICSSCCDVFSDLTEYENHKILHSCDDQDSSLPVVYSCPVSDCFQICQDKEHLMDHISWHEDRDVDEEQESLQHCQHCMEVFRNQTSLERHLVETHDEPGFRPFVCELCSEGFRLSQELHCHNTSFHAGIRRYGCAYCNQRFAFRSSHRHHVASEHDVPATVLHM